MLYPVIHAAFIEVKDGPARQLSEFAPEEQSLDFAALAIFYKFF